MLADVLARFVLAAERYYREQMWLLLNEIISDKMTRMAIVYADCRERDNILM